MDIKESFLNIISTVKDIEISNLDDSIFSSKYALAPNEIAYVLIMASKKFGFQISDELIDMLEIQSSFTDIINAIKRSI